MSREVWSGYMAESIRPLVGVSLKLHLGYRESLRWLRTVAETCAGRGELFVLPAYPLLPAAAEALAGTGVRFGAQDVAAAAGGAYTGEVSARMLAELGASFAEVGHAERRRFFGETDAVVAAKVAAAIGAGLIPVVCVGEADRVAPATATRRALEQLDRATDGAPVDAPLVVAYEPVWAIGANRAAGPAHILSVIAALRDRLADRAGAAAVLYGGAAGPGIFPDLAAAAGDPSDLPDGLFVGRAGLDVPALGRILDEVTGAIARGTIHQEAACRVLP